MTLLLLLACSDPATISVDDTGNNADLAASLTTAESRADDAEARLDAAEARIAALEATVATLTATVDGHSTALATDEATATDHATRIAGLEGSVAELATRADDDDVRDAGQDGTLVDVEAAIVALQTDDADADAWMSEVDGWMSETDGWMVDADASFADLGVSTGTTSALTMWTSTASGRGGAGWNALTDDLSLTLTSTSSVAVWCAGVELSTNVEFRVTMEATDGSWSDSTDAIGTYPAAMGYSGESWTVVGTFDPPAAGDYTVSCEGSSSNAGRVSLLAMQG